MVPQAEDPAVVFVVYGRNSRLRGAMFEFLRSIGLRPLEWSQAVKATGKPSPYIGEILDTAFFKAQAVVVLMTPDDEARLREPLRTPEDLGYESVLTPQARPNVLFEAGMALGRSPGRTILVEVGSLRPFTDIAGIHTIKMDNTSAKRQDLAQRLERAGCPVDLTGIDWHTAGDFDIVAEAERVVPEPAKSTSKVVGRPKYEHYALSRTEVDILEKMAEMQEQASDQYLGIGLGIGLSKARYLLGKLAEVGYVRISSQNLVTGAITYALTQEGRAWLYEDQTNPQAQT